MAVHILFNWTTCWLSIKWELPAPETEFLLLGGSVFHAQQHTDLRWEGTAFLPSTGFHPGGLCSDHGDASLVPGVTSVPSGGVEKEPLSNALERLGSISFVPCDCDSVAHLKPFCSVSFKDLCSGWPWGGQPGAGSCAGFWNLLRHRAGM